MLRPTAISVTVQKDYTLKVIFNNGETKIFDVKPYIKGSWYSRLKDFSYFSLSFYKYTCSHEPINAVNYVRLARTI